MDLEYELKKALRRTAPEPGLAGRVLARIDAAEQRTSHWRGWRAAAAAAVLMAIVGGWSAHEAVERRRGEAAKEQVMLALRIAGEKVRVAQDEVRRER